MHPVVHSSVIYNSQDQETAQVPISTCIDSKVGVHLCNRILCSHKNAAIKNLLFIILLFKYSCLHFHPTMTPDPTHPHLLHSNPPPLALSMCLSYVFLDGLPYYPFPLSFLGTVSLFFISMSLVVFCLLVCFID